MVARAERVALSSGQRRVAVAGNPNSGKTVIFNTLTGLRHKVGNYPGVTVEKREGTLAGTDVTLLDLPGAYGLSARSPDQEIARDALLGRIQGTRRPDGVLLVIDASNLERNLYLASQILDVGMPVVIACNMMDVAAERGLHVDCDALTHELGVPVIPTVATKGVGITDLRRALDNVDHHKPPPRPWRLPPPFEDAIERAADAMARSGATPPYAAHGSALLWLSDYLSGEAASRRSAEKYLADLAPPYAAELCAAAAVVDEHSNDAAAEAIEARYAWISNVAQRVVVAEPESPDHTGHTPTDRIDRVLTHRVFGLVIFIGLMFVLFLSIFSWAEPLMDLIEAGQEALTDWIGPMFDEGPLKSLITDGIIAGVGSVIIFFPQICILFLCLAVLEDSGYMARAAFLMDRLMSRVGLHGRSFIPLLSCYACAIPGIMATRTIENKRDRFTTILVAPLMSCSARMPVYLIIIAAVFADNTWLKAGTMFGLYVLGTAAALLMALIFKKTLLAGPRPTFIMELPPYHVPRLLPILRVMWDRSRVFLTHAGTIIFAACILIWALSYFPYIDESELPPDVQARLAALDDHQEQTRSSPWQNCGTGVSPVVFTVRNGVSEPLFSLSPRAGRAHHATPPSNQEAQDPMVRAADPAWMAYPPTIHNGPEQARENIIAAARLRNSYLGRIGHAIEPAIKPLGYDWRIGIGLLSSFLAREVFVGTMGITFAIGEVDEESEALRDRLAAATWPDGRPVLTPLVGVGLMVFYVLACQCVSTVAVVRRETNSWRWPALMFTYMTILAYVSALLVHQIGIQLGLGAY